MTVRQEVHPDEFDRIGELLGWLATRADDRHRTSPGTVHLGWTRFYESDRTVPWRGGTARSPGRDARGARPVFVAAGDRMAYEDGCVVVTRPNGERSSHRAGNSYWICR
ncbi:hypothetical protein [Kitasatospora camelliae]|uniref:Uncharacterized protein n=1 Tax=Kitasatospora camelliae TaxID=3156397 RepID=A0AAU8JRP4_9ACTN